ncbi:MAG: glycosyltransferase [Flavobacteriales bacterium]|nr:glycosyltransferase [Flavobacteriales bacterium]
MEIIISITGITYLITIGYLWMGIRKILDFRCEMLEGRSEILDVRYETFVGFSIVVPFRNEEKSLPNLLQSLSQLDYPLDKFEIILVDDESTDNSVEVIKRTLENHPDIQYQILSRIPQSNSPKKDAITQGIAKSQFEWIITTDADCTVRPEWLSLYNQKANNGQAKMIAGAVCFPKQKGLLNQFQYYDLISLQGVTLGAFGHNNPFMCNGANFAYAKSFFNDLNGFKDSNNVASGDDVLLLQKAVKTNPEAIQYILHPNHVVQTTTESTWKVLFMQRVRWAAKTSSYTHSQSKWIALIVFFTNGILASSPFLYCEYGNKIWSLWLIKLIIDSLFIRLSAKKLDQKFELFPALLSGLIYPFFSMAVALYSFVGKFDWKGREFRK